MALIKDPDTAPLSGQCIRSNEFGLFGTSCTVYMMLYLLTLDEVSGSLALIRVAGLEDNLGELIVLKNRISIISAVDGIVVAVVVLLL